jgi:hypothetical protein
MGPGRCCGMLHKPQPWELLSLRLVAADLQSGPDRQEHAGHARLGADRPAIAFHVLVPWTIMLSATSIAPGLSFGWKASSGSSRLI